MVPGFQQPPSSLSFQSPQQDVFGDLDLSRIFEEEVLNGPEETFSTSAMNNDNKTTHMLGKEFFPQQLLQQGGSSSPQQPFDQYLIELLE